MTMTKSWGKTTLLWSIASVVLFQPAQCSMVADITPGSQQCWFVRVPDDRPSVISGNYDLLEYDVDEDKISAWLEKRLGQRKGSTVWRSEENDDENTFSVSVDARGKFAFCLRVDESVDEDDYEGDAVHIGFNLRVAPMPRTLEDEVVGPDAEWAMELLQSANFVENDWKNFIDHFDYMRSREATHTALMHQIRDRVLGWTVVEAILVITMAVGQILYWKRFFEKRRYL